jgi:hypothetical protein
VVGRLRWQKTVDRALLGPSTRALECGPALRDRFCASSLLEVLPEASFGKAAASCRTPERFAPTPAGIKRDAARPGLAPRFSYGAKRTLDKLGLI